MCPNAKFSVSITQPFNKSEDLAIAKKSTATYWVPIDLPELDFLWSKEISVQANNQGHCRRPIEFLTSTHPCLYYVYTLRSLS